MAIWLSRKLCAHADLDQAMRKAMDAIGMTAAVPGFQLDGFTGSQRERQLLDRIAQLEAQLQPTRILT